MEPCRSRGKTSGRSNKKLIVISIDKLLSLGLHSLAVYLPIDFTASRHASEIIQQRCEEGVLASVDVWFYWSDPVQTGRLTRMGQVKDAVCWGSVRGLCGNGGHHMRHGRGGRRCGGKRSRIQRGKIGLRSNCRTQKFCTVGEQEDRKRSEGLLNVIFLTFTVITLTSLVKKNMLIYFCSTLNVTDLQKKTPNKHVLCSFNPFILYVVQLECPK